MFSRSIRSPLIRTIRAARPVRSVRFNSSKPASGSGSSGSNSGGSGGISRGQILAALGVLAVGSSVAASLYSKEEPVSAVEPKKPALSEKDVSVIFVLGGPGSGKGTQCGKLVEEKGFLHLSAGDLLRSEQNREGSQYGSLIAQCIKEGTIVPQEVTVALLAQAITENYTKGSTRFLVDGFPRKMDQAITFEEQIVPSAFTLFFECPEQVMLERLLERGKTSGRADDNIESIKKRFRVFVDTSMPVVDYFDKQGKVVKLRCDDSVDVVYGHVKEALAKRGIE